MAARRLTKELQEVSKQIFKNDDTDSIELGPLENNLFVWNASFFGPSGTPYEGGKFHIRINVPNNYPMNPPKAYFITPIFHPNIHFKSGEICLDILKDRWSPALTLLTVCRSIRSLLDSPEADSPFNCDAGNLIQYGDYRGFRSMASMYTRLHAMPEDK